MKRRSILIICLLVVATGLELFYFKFHTFFMRTEVQDALPTPQGSVIGAPTATPRTVAQGTFGEINAFHKGSGTARIIETAGKRYLRLENFEVTNGPDLYLYLAESTTPGASLESLGRYVSLGPLKGNAGNQTYELSASSLGYNTAVIWCQQFGVLFSYAVMR